MTELDAVSTRGYEMTKTGIVFRRALSDAEYDALGVKIAHLHNATAWAIGDWLVAGTGRGPEGNAYGRAHDLTGRSYQSLSVYSRVSAAYVHTERGLVVWSMYREALRLPTKERVQTLRLAQGNGWNRNGLVDFINTRLDEGNAIDISAHQPDVLFKRVGRIGWHRANVPKRDVTCPACGHRFDVRRKGLTEAPIEPGEQRADRRAARRGELPRA